MYRFSAYAVAVLATLGPAIAAEPPSSALSVTFVHPETYADASKSYARGSDPQVLEAIRQHLQTLAARELPPGYSLSIDILDIDLAGYIDGRYRGEVRVIRDATWPRMTLRYVLKHDEDTVASQQERIHDMNFNWGVNQYGYGDPLRHEKAMLDDWFEKAIAHRVHG